MFFVKKIVGGFCFFLFLFFSFFVFLVDADDSSYWFLLHRMENKEFLYFGVPGDARRSELVRTFVVKSGIPGERPTPLPYLVGREYWVITRKYADDNPETAPYFLAFDVPGVFEEPYGPVPYEECDGPASSADQQCNWVLPGEFGLHGVNGDMSRLSEDNPGSSGCVRHSDSDITYLYDLLHPEREEIRYYIIDQRVLSYFAISDSFFISYYQ
jgi:hypothetical protein